MALVLSEQSKHPLETHSRFFVDLPKITSGAVDVESIPCHSSPADINRKYSKDGFHHTRHIL